MPWPYVFIESSPEKQNQEYTGGHVRDLLWGTGSPKVNWEVPKPAAHKTETQGSGWCNSVQVWGPLVTGAPMSRPSSSRELESALSFFVLLKTDPINRLDRMTSTCIGEDGSSLLRLTIQIPFPETPWPVHLEIIFYWSSGHLLAQLSWHIKLIIKPSVLLKRWPFIAILSFESFLYIFLLFTYWVLNHFSTIV